MKFPLGFDDISLWLAVSSIILLTTSELLKPYHSQSSMIIESGRLRRVALILGVLFLFTNVIKIYEIIVSI
jgi:hypothetical protein